MNTLQYIHTRNNQILQAPKGQQAPIQLVGKSNYVSQRSINSLSNDSASRWTNSVMPVFKRATTIGYPIDTDGVPMLIHPQLQGRDFTPLTIGDPVFVDIDGKTVIPFAPSHPFWATQENFPGFDEPLYPFFINEAAYYEKNVAFALAKKKDRPIQVLNTSTKLVSNL